MDGDFIFTCTSSTTQKTDTVKKLNSVDFEKLQQAIEDLSGAASILLRLFGRG